GTAVSLRVRDRRFDFDQRLVGGEITLHKSVGQQTFTYGIELTQTDTEQLRSGGETNLTTGLRNTTVGPDAFPVRDFPISKTEQIGAYIQDDIRLGAFSLLPGVRVDRYELKPDTDDIFIADNPGITPQSIDRTSVNPRLGAVYRATESVSAFGSY